jgi:hypothetical protein
MRSPGRMWRRFCVNKARQQSFNSVAGLERCHRSSRWHSKSLRTEQRDNWSDAGSTDFPRVARGPGVDMLRSIAEPNEKGVSQLLGLSHSSFSWGWKIPPDAEHVRNQPAPGSVVSRAPATAPIATLEKTTTSSGSGRSRQGHSAAAAVQTRPRLRFLGILASHDDFQSAS